MNDVTKPIEKITFANTEEEAEGKFNKYAIRDPLPDVPPALLNSTDIRDYVAITGMIFPFHPEPEKGKFKTASYEVDLLGEIIYWDEDGIKKCLTLKRGDSFILRKNSIAYVTPEPTFRLPNYIALRFNLKIANVHRGILLGTGPLVDPGYEGKLLIPLHNLTNNNYTFLGGEGFIWIEFTKLSPILRHEEVMEQYERSVSYADVHPEKKKLGPDQLIAKALKGQEASIIQSSIPAVAGQANKAAQDARHEVARITLTMKKLLGFSFLALVLALATIVVTVLIGNRQFINIGQENMRQIEQLRQEVKNQNMIICEMRNSITSGKSTANSPQSRLPNEKGKR